MHRTLIRIQQICQDMTGDEYTFFFDGVKYTWKLGRHQDDGSVTGAVFSIAPDGKKKRSGNFRIEPDGEISKGPRSFKDIVFGAGSRNCVQ